MCSPVAKKCQQWLVTCASDAGPVFVGCVKTMALLNTEVNSSVCYKHRVWHSLVRYEADYGEENHLTSK